MKTNKGLAGLVMKGTLVGALGIESAFGFSDNLKIINFMDTADNGYINLKHHPNALEGRDYIGQPVGDSLRGQIAPADLASRIWTTVEGFEFWADGRPDTSQSLFDNTLALQINSNPSGEVIKDVVLYLQGRDTPTFDGLDPNRLYIARANIYSQFTTNSSEFLNYKNIKSLVNTNNVDYAWNLTQVHLFNSQVNSNNEVLFGNIKVSCKFTNQLSQTGNKTPITINLSDNQVGGLEYVLTSGTNVNGEAHIENGTNLVYTPDSSFVGTNNINSRLKWNGNDLGDINYAVGVTNQAIPVLYAPSMLGITNMGDGNVQIGARVSPGNDYKHILQESTNVYAPNWIPIATNTVPFANDTNQVNTVYSRPIDKPKAFFRVESN